MKTVPSFRFRAAIFWCFMMLGFSPSLAEAISKASIITALQTCCFKSPDSKILLFKQPIEVTLYDFSNLDELDRSSIKSSIELLQYQTGISFDFKIEGTPSVDVSKSTLNIAILPHEKTKLGDDDFARIRSLIIPYSSQIDVSNLMDELYKPGAFALIAKDTPDRRSSSLFIVAMQFGNVRAEQAVEMALLSSLGYNRRAQPIDNSVFSDDAAIITSVDVETLKLLYKNADMLRPSYDDLLKMLQ